MAGDGGGDLVFQVADLVGERQDAPGQQPQGVDSGAGGVAGCIDLQLSAATDEQQVAQPGECFAQLRVRRHKHRFELVDRLGAGLDGGGLGQLEHAQHLHRPVTGLRRRAGPTAEYCPSSCFGVEGVGLAPSAAGGLVGLVDLNHLDTGRPQVTG